MVKRDSNALYCDDASLTQQHFAEECDINEIMRRSALSGVLPVNNKVPVYGDFTLVPKDLYAAYAMIKQASDLFMSLPWQVRERFNNDPGRMIEFLQDPRNRDDAVRLGMVKAEVKPALPASPPAGEPAKPAQ